MKRSFLFSMVVFTILLMLSSCARTSLPTQKPAPAQPAPPRTSFSEPSETKKLDPVRLIWPEIIPAKGTATRYGIPLSLDNTQKFIDWYNSKVLSTSERAIRDAALAQLVAPCCDDYPVSTC